MYLSVYLYYLLMRTRSYGTAYPELRFGVPGAAVGVPGTTVGPV